jgi:ParB-like chromosome segregation protein Spo0J
LFQSGGSEHRSSERRIVTVAAIASPPAQAPTSEVVTISLEELRVGPSMRAGGIDPLHVAALAEVASHWPPIVVSRSDSTVIDGQHRVAAARQLGLRKLTATWFDGSADEIYIEFVRRNVGHGLPLTLAERRAAARQMLRGQGGRSDRAIASVCGISPTTIARLRKEIGAAKGSNPQGTRGRVGLDGRVRPLNGLALRARIAEQIALQPDASLRTIATIVGASPETVRSVRNELRSGRDVASYRLGDAPGRDENALAPCEAAVAPRDDRAFADREGGQEFVDWFEATSVEELDPWRYLDAIPLSRVYEIADIARQRADFWARFAKALETRVRRWA